MAGVVEKSRASAYVASYQEVTLVSARHLIKTRVKPGIEGVDVGVSVADAVQTSDGSEHASACHPIPIIAPTAQS